MTNVVTAVDARRSLGNLLNIVSLRHEEIIIERAGKPIARLCPCEDNEHRAGMGKLDFRKSRGLGQKLWKGIDVDKYIGKERAEWT